MLVTKETDYAVRCVVYLAREHNQVASVTEIAQQMRIPRTFLAKITQRLMRENIVESVRGINGGFRLLKNPEQLSLLEVFTAIQGIAPVSSCAVDKRKCAMSSHCGVHPVWTQIRREIEHRLAAHSISSLT